MVKKLCSLLASTSFILCAHNTLSPEAELYRDTGRVIITADDLVQARAARATTFLIGATGATLFMAQLANHYDIVKDIKNIPGFLSTIFVCTPILAYFYAHAAQSTNALTAHAYQTKLTRIVSEIDRFENGTQEEIRFLSDTEAEDRCVYEAYPDRIRKDDLGNTMTDPMGTPIAQPC